VLVGDEVRLRLPGNPEYGRMARTASTSLARGLGFSFREVEDLGLAIDESVVLLWQPSDEDLPGLELVLTTTEDGLMAALTLTVGPDDELPPALSSDALARFVELSAELGRWTSTVRADGVDIVGRRAR